MRKRFAGSTVLVTGGGTGIGRAIVLAFAEGAHVVATGRSEEPLREVAAEADGSVDPLIADIRTAAGARMMVSEAIERNGRLDVLVNNAGIGITRGVLDHTEEDWDDSLATNLSGAFWASQAAAQHMVERGGGAIVNVASSDASYVNGETIVVDGGMLKGAWWMPDEAPPVPPRDET